VHAFLKPSEGLRNGARKLLMHAVETEVAEFIGRYRDLVTEEGRQRVVRHGHLPEREIMRPMLEAGKPACPS
jgi:putative transposase